MGKERVSNLEKGTYRLIVLDPLGRFLVQKTSYTLPSLKTGIMF